jgi:acyl carrier protein
MTNSQAVPRSAEEIREWIVGRLSAHADIDPQEVQLDEPVISHGIDSMQFVVLVGELEDWLGCRFAQNPIVEYPTINALSEFLADQLRQGKTLIDPTQD